jgi:DNA primase
MSTTVDQVKAKLNIVEVVGSYVKLEKAGINYKGRCPFHHEKTPSFFVSPARQSYHCFGCNQGGDLISFVEAIEGLDFLGALRVLAERAGVPMGPVVKSEGDERSRLFTLLDQAKNYYGQILVKTPTALSYLKKRGVLPATIKNFELGYAGDDWHGLYRFLKGQQFRDQEIEAAGLIIPSTRGMSGPGYYDRFRQRIMFPLRDGAGRVVGFSGRIFPDDAKAAKYINSPQTKLYDKSQILYGYDVAKLAIRERDGAVLVEGQLDLLMSHQAGVKNTVAVSGTALTEKHLELIRRLTNNIVMAFDGDSAGIQASRRAVELCLSLDLEAKIAALPTGVDPAELILQDPAAWEQAIKNAKQVIDFYLDLIKERGLEDRDLTRAIRQEVYPLVARLRQRTDHAYFIQKICALTGLREEVVRADLRDLVNQQVRVESKVGDTHTKSSRQLKIEEKVFGLMWWQANQAWQEQVAAVYGPELWLAREQYWQSQRANLVLAAEVAYAAATPQALQQEAAELIKNLAIEVYKERLQQMMKELSIAESKGDSTRAQELLNNCQRISRQLHALTTGGKL